MYTFPSLAEIKAGAVLLVDKPYRWTSFDALNKIRKQIHTKIGHCGTLDPLATGLLICCTGKMTKSITQYQKQPKEYTGVFHLGAETPTYDLESEPVNPRPYDQLSEGDIRSAAEQFTGKIEQVPPVHSAVKKDGKRAYEMARQGIEVKLEPRIVTVSEFEITRIELPDVYFRVACSTGTYIRSLAHDMGKVLGCGAYLAELRRTAIGDFRVEQAPDVAAWVEYLQEENERERAGKGA